MSANKQVLAQIKILASQQECTAAAIEELSKHSLDAPASEPGTDR